MSIQLLREVFASTGEIGFACHVRADVVIPYPQTFAVVKGVSVSTARPCVIKPRKDKPAGLYAL